MIQEQYCGLKEHQIVTSVCVIEHCDYQQRLVCNVCNSKQFHNHNQETNSHLLDLERIKKNQEALKDQSFQYHSKIINFQEMLDIIRTCKSLLNNLDSILNEYMSNYKKYFANLNMIQIILNLKDYQKYIDNELAKIMKEIQDFNEVENKQKSQIVSNEILMNFSKLNDQIQNKTNKTSDSKLFQVVNHKYQIQFAQISPNGQDLLFGSNWKLYSFNIQQCSYQEICNISNRTESFEISKDYQQFYFDYNGAIKIYNRNLGNCLQIQLQKKYKIQLIMVLSKVLACAYQKRISQLCIINLKLKKIVFKLQYYNIVDMHYIEDQNLLIVAQLKKVDIIMLNSKIKSQQLDYHNTRIHNIQFNQQNQQLVILDDQRMLGVRGILTFWNLDENGQFIKSLFQIQMEQSLIGNFIFNQSLQQYLVFTKSEILFYNVQGQIIKRLPSISEQFCKKYQQKQACKNSFSNYCQEPIVIREKRQYYNNYHDSITLLWVNKQ